MWKNNRLFPGAAERAASRARSSLRRRSHAKHGDVFLITPTKFTHCTASKQNISYFPEAKLTLGADTQFEWTGFVDWKLDIQALREQPNTTRII